MNILIVDDIEDNRDALKRLIKQYSRKYNNAENIVYEAENGEVAVDICKNSSIDLIFMDITMPIMNGLEATKIIKKQHPSVMIIVVSSEADEGIKKEVLHHGAEDYIMKPFSSSIMISRLNNYSKLISSRNSINYQAKALNLFTNKVYSYQMNFFVSSEDELAQLWETLLLRLDFNKHIEHLSDLMRLLYNLIYLQINKSYKCNVTLEEDHDHFYFTLNNIHLLNKDTVTKLLEKCTSPILYEIKNDLLSFAVARKAQTSEVTSEPSNASETSTPMQSAPVIIPKEVVLPQKEELKTYNLLDEEDLEELEFTLDKLATEITMMGSSSLEIDDIDTMNTYIQRISVLLSTSNDSYNISISLGELCGLLNEYSHEFLAESKNLSQMMLSFLNDLRMWKDMIFYTGAPSPDFLDSSISSNIQMIRAVFVTEEDNASDLDDIFDF